MGNEYGQFKEWDYEEGLEFFMLDFELHKKLFRYNKKLNNIYKNSRPLYEIDDSWSGFNWISVDERDNNVLAFKRIDNNGTELIALFNFSGKDFNSYRLGVDNGEYSLLLNSDAKKFGGSGIIKKRIYKSSRKKAHNSDYSINIKLPKHTAMYFIKNEQ